MWKCSALAIALMFGLWYYLSFFTKSTLMAGASIRVRIVNINTNASETNTVDKKSRKKIKHHVPKFMLELYEKSLRGEFDGNYTQPDIVRSVIPKSAEFIHYDKVCRSYQDNHLLVFDVPSASEDEEFVSADLKILTIIEIDGKSLKGLERIVKISIYNDTEKTLNFLEQVKVRQRNNTWMSFNLTAPVSALLGRGKVNSLLKIVISIRDFLPYARSKNEKFKLSLLPMDENLEHDYPVLLLAYTSHKENGTRKTRKKRNLGDDYEEETNNLWDDDANKKVPMKRLKRLRNTCRRKALYVDFAEIQYDLWIVQPSGYEAYQCHGKCFYPVAEHLSPTKHAIVQALLHSVSPSKATRSCCVPTKLESISVLYVDGNGVLTYRYAYKDMVVTECGCR